MSDTWNDIQALKNRSLSLREKHLRRKRELEAIKAGITDPGKDGAPSGVSSASKTGAATSESSEKKASSETDKPQAVQVDPELLPSVEKEILVQLSDVGLNLPLDAPTLTSMVTKALDRDVPLPTVENLLQKLVAQQLVSLKSKEAERVGMPNTLNIVSISHKKLSAVSGLQESGEAPAKRRKTEQEDEGKQSEKIPPASEAKDVLTVESLLSTHSAKERENKKVNEEILELLSAPTAKEQTLLEKFKSQGGAQLQEFCQFGTNEECRKVQGSKCDKLHFKKIINKHTDESLGDCSFLNTCFHMDSCKYVHYEIAYPEGYSKAKTDVPIKKTRGGEKDETTVLFPQQWVQCDLRHFDMSVLGKFAIIMADPPWDIHMELPYGTMSDDEMRRLDVPSLQDDGYIFLWVTGRAMELGRECLQLWGYNRVDELIWVKTNQLQRIIRTGRTGHWLNHGKEHCLVGAKGNPKNMNNGMDCDVIVAEVRATSHKPDEVYGIIERLSPGTRKIELFGRPHNVQPNWVTLGNQLDGVKLLDPEVVKAFKKRYPDGNCMKPKQPQQLSK